LTIKITFFYFFNAKSRLSSTRKFALAFRRQYKIAPDAYAAEGYEGFKLVAFSFIRCHKNYDCIKSYLENLTNYQSVFGRLGFDKNGDVYYKFFLKQVKNNSFVKYMDSP
jgi:ABC-type branched-subunit amino acid transport system substrate-binding protein